MKEIIIQCPNCKTEIPVSEVLGSQIRAQLEADLQNEHQQHQLQQEIAAAETRTRHGAAMERAGEADRTRRNPALTHDFFAYDKTITYSISEKNISQIVVDSGKSRWHD